MPMPVPAPVFRTLGAFRVRRQVVARVLPLLLAIVLVSGCASLDAEVATSTSVPGTPGIIPEERGCVWTASGTPRAGTPAASPAATPGPVHGMNEPVVIQTLTVTVNSVSCPPQVGDGRAGPGKQFVIVDFSVENTSNTVQTVSAKFQTSLRAASGQVYRPDDLASQYGGEEFTGQVPAKDRRSGRVGFQVPTDETGLVFIFDSRPFGSQGQAFIAIQ